MTGNDRVYVVAIEEIPGGEDASTFHGHAHGAPVSFFLSHNRPGTGPKLHRHPYQETFVVQDGDVLFTVGERTIEAQAGDIVVVPAGAPHKLVSRGATHGQISIHPGRPDGDRMAGVTHSHAARLGTPSGTAQARRHGRLPDRISAPGDTGRREPCMSVTSP